MLLSLFATPQALAQFQLSDEMPGLPITGEMQVIEDPERLFTIDELLNREWPANQTTNKKAKTVKGVNGSAWWVMLDVENPGDSKIDWVLEAVYTHTDYLDIYHIDTQGKITTVQTGDKRPFSDRPLPSESFAFPLSTAIQWKRSCCALPTLIVA